MFIFPCEVSLIQSDRAEIQYFNNPCQMSYNDPAVVSSARHYTVSEHPRWPAKFVIDSSTISEPFSTTSGVLELQWQVSRHPSIPWFTQYTQYGTECMVNGTLEWGISPKECCRETSLKKANRAKMIWTFGATMSSDYGSRLSSYRLVEQTVLIQLAPHSHLLKDENRKHLSKKRCMGAHCPHKSCCLSPSGLLHVAH